MLDAAALPGIEKAHEGRGGEGHPKAAGVNALERRSSGELEAWRVLIVRGRRSTLVWCQPLKAGHRVGMFA